MMHFILILIYANGPDTNFFEHVIQFNCFEP